jgi:ADP-heptose:LPS heptosyltransferase
LRGGTAYGDLLMLTPALRGLREQHPARPIHFFGRKKVQAVLGNNPHLDRFVPLAYTRPNIEALRARYTRTHDLHFRHTLNTFCGDLRNAYELCCDHVGVTPSTYTPVFCPTQQDVDAARTLLHDLDPDLPSEGFILIHAETANLRRLPDPTAVEVARRLAALGHKVVFVGIERDFPQRARALGGCGPRVYCLQEVAHTYPARTMFTLSLYAKLLLAVDSVFSHVAGAVGTPSLLVFGAIDSRLRARHFLRSHILQTACACGPCNLGAGHCLSNRQGVAPCMEQVVADEIVEAACAVLAGSRPAGALTAEQLARDPDVSTAPEACTTCLGKNAVGVARIKDHAFYRCPDCGCFFTRRYENAPALDPVIFGNDGRRPDDGLREAFGQIIADQLQGDAKRKRALAFHCEGSPPALQDVPAPLDSVEFPISVWRDKRKLNDTLLRTIAAGSPTPGLLILDDVLNRCEDPRQLVRRLRERMPGTPVAGRLPIADFYRRRAIGRNGWVHFITPFAGQNRWIPTVGSLMETMHDEGYACEVAVLKQTQEVVFRAR